MYKCLAIRRFAKKVLFNCGTASIYVPKCFDMRFYNGFSDHLQIIRYTAFRFTVKYNHI